MKKGTVIVLLMVLLFIGLVTMYGTYAIDSENIELKPSTADYNLIYNMRENSDKEVNLKPSEEKYIEILVKNPYSTKVKYGIYYSVKNGTNNIDATLVSKIHKGQDILEPSEEKNVTIKIKNNDEKESNIILGTLVGFQNGDVSDLVKSGEILIK